MGCLTVSKMPVHDFQRNIDVARTDPGFKKQLISYLNSDELVPIDNSDLIGVTCGHVNHAIGESRALYASDPERLVCVIAASNISNAFAIWGSTTNDWVVLTEGLLKEIRESAENAATRLLSHFPEVLNSSCGKRIRSAASLEGGFSTSLGSLLYAAAIGFFVGHEAGHHLEGHDAFFKSGRRPPAFSSGLI